MIDQLCIFIVKLVGFLGLAILVVHWCEILCYRIADFFEVSDMLIKAICDRYDDKPNRYEGDS
jgi:hypothetical protein